jgi:hypothetical protein
MDQLRPKLIKMPSSSSHSDASSLTAATAAFDEDVSAPVSGKQLATLADELFKQTSIAIYCDLACSPTHSACMLAAAAPPVDNTEAITMLLLNNLVDLLELAAANEPSVWHLFASIHRNASASSLFIHSVSACWPRLCAKSRLYLLHACLRTLEAVHLRASQHLVCLLMDKVCIRLRLTGAVQTSTTNCLSLNSVY